MSYKNLAYKDIQAIADGFEGNVSESLAKEIIVACLLDLVNNLPNNIDSTMEKNIQDLLAITGISEEPIKDDEPSYLLLLAQRNPEIAKLIEPTLKAALQ